MKGFLQQPYVIGLKCLLVQHAPRLFLRPVGPELLEVGPNICDVLVVLDPEERHSSARHLLPWRANVFVERLWFQVRPEDLVTGEQWKPVIVRRLGSSTRL